jgi:S-adenosylmethionine hydrolase
MSSRRKQKTSRATPARPKPARPKPARPTAARPTAARHRSPARWRANGIVTLLTDFGASDPYVGMMKGVLLAHHPGAIAVDITHDVPAQDVRLAAWFLKHASAFFAEGTVHVAVVDPGVGSSRRLLVARDRGHAFLAPDNGLLAPALSRDAEVYELDVARFARAGASRTFHGRDILAPAAAAIAAGRAPRDCAVARVDDWTRLFLPEPRPRSASFVEGEVLHADRYGNLVLNLAPEDLARGPKRASERDLARGPKRASERDATRWRLEAGGRTIPIRGHYAEARAGELVALVDSYGQLEIAVRDGSAADALRLRAGARVKARRRR